MTTKKWLTLFFIFSFLLIGVVGFFNYIVDPFNIFSHKNRCNSLAVGFNERVQKSAYLKYNSTQDYDAILLGSSRATYYNQEDFKGVKLYNFAFSGAIPSEYNYYLEFSRKYNSKAFSTIILGLDFYTFNDNYQVQAFSTLGNKFLFFVHNYFALDTMKYSIINCKHSLFQTTGHRSYDRKNIVHSDKILRDKVKLLAKKRSLNYYSNFKEYNTHYVEILTNLKSKNKPSKFIVYTSPLSKEFLDVIYHDKKLLKFYYLWLESITKVFDKVYCFTLPSEFSEHYQKYSLDGDHFYPDITPRIANILLDKKEIKGYGKILTHESIKQFIENGVER